MKRALWAAVSLLAVGLPATAAEMGGVIDAIEARQDYIPVGKAQLASGEEWRFYLLDGPLSIRAPKPGQDVLRYAVFLDVDGGAALHVVEVGGVSCSSDTAWPSYRLILDKDGRMLASTGPVEVQTEGHTLMTEEAVKTVAAYLCRGETPPFKIKDQTLADYR
ncbi:MAG: hypothetical protein Q7T61_18920 [Caulobacter sp.]|nr:hypothetical protein [Caulobacter sp.]